MPTLHEELRESVVTILRKSGFHPLPHGVYGNARGPRFETKSEIRQMATYADVVGMTAAHEVSACCEVGLPYAMLCCVDNFANGVGQEALTLDAFHHAQAANLITVEKCVAAILQSLPSVNSLCPSSSVPSTSSSSSSSTGASAIPGPELVDLVIHARWIVTMAPFREQEVLDRHALVVLKGIIHDILPSNEVQGKYVPTKIVDLGEEHVLMPGLVNAHTHLALNFLRGVADDLPLAEWLSEQIWPTEGRLVDTDFVRAGTRAAAAELIRGGVTCINEMYWFPNEVAEALDEVGLRGLIAMVVLEFPSRYAGNSDEYINKGVEIRSKWLEKNKNVVNPRITFGFGPHAPYTVADRSFEKIRDLSNTFKCPIHIHLHETAGEVLASRTGGKEGSSKHLSDSLTSPLENLDRIGLIDEKLIAVHMTCLEDKDIALLSNKGANVVHCPSSNLKLASGFCPVAKLLKSGVNVALGTDSASSNNALNMWAEIKLAAILAKGVAGDATAVPAWQALQMATYNGAKALGLEKSIGSLEIGKQADMIAVKLGNVIETTPMFNVLSHLTYAVDRSAVTDVWVQGAPLLMDRYLTTIDEVQILKEMKEWAQKVRPLATAFDRNESIAPKHRRPLCCGCGGSSENNVTVTNSSSSSSSKI